ncbi:MAG: enoyl-CoA hydratase/isomerase family protein [Cellvibrionaceae bacterium]
MSTMRLEVQDGIHVLTLTNNDNENKLNLDVIKEYLAALDTVEAYQGNTALLITCEHEKTFSTGIDLEWLITRTEEQRAEFVLTLEQLLYRLALLNAPSVVALNGNAYAGGAIIATAADFRLMRSDRGRFCFPEVNINIPFTPMMIDIIDLLPNKHALKHMALIGAAYTGEECATFDIVDSIHPQQELPQAAMALAKMLGEKDRATYTSIKRDLRSSISRHAEALGLA